mmetsp:Transcript_19707/g.70096  ORF Transcript_19707/g.70096 Transcript_19707/m.70096 type:complete len:410 (-) Transcript_19707:50-1279(-)
MMNVKVHNGDAPHRDVRIVVLGCAAVAAPRVGGGDCGRIQKAKAAAAHVRRLPKVRVRHGPARARVMARRPAGDEACAPPRVLARHAVHGRARRARRGQRRVKRRRREARVAVQVHAAAALVRRLRQVARRRVGPAGQFAARGARRRRARSLQMCNVVVVVDPQHICQSRLCGALLDVDFGEVPEHAAIGADEDVQPTRVLLVRLARVVVKAVARPEHQRAAFRGLAGARLGGLVGTRLRGLVQFRGRAHLRRFQHADGVGRRLPCCALLRALVGAEAHGAPPRALAVGGFVVGPRGGVVGFLRAVVRFTLSNLERAHPSLQLVEEAAVAVRADHRARRRSQAGGPWRGVVADWRGLAPGPVFTAVVLRSLHLHRRLFERRGFEREVELRHRSARAERRPPPAAPRRPT